MSCLLPAAQNVVMVLDRHFGKDAGCLLERGGQDGRVGRQRYLGNTQSYVFVSKDNKKRRPQAPISFG
jgi:hypothetical protein